MSTNVSDWREKYLDSLDERDRLKIQFERRHELLRRALVRVSLAAEGQSEDLDRELGKLRAGINSDGQLTLVVDRLEEIILSEEAASKPTASRAAGLLDRFWSRPADCPPESGAGTKYSNGCITDVPGNGPAPAGQQQQQAVAPLQPVSQTEAAAATFDAPLQSLPDEDSARIQTILMEFLERIEPVECTRQKAENARARLARGMAWSELAPTLEDIRDLVLHSYLEAGEEHRAFLLHMHQQLQEVVASIGGVASSYQKVVAADRELEQELQLQLDSMGKSVKQASRLEVLKQEIDQHLGLIQQALEKRQRQREDTRAVGQLDVLTLRLRQVEEEAKSAKEELETQKQKATTDVLTGLPNREAYNQRAHTEWKRKQRFGHSLTVAVCDIDKFKTINDKFGHQAGDRVLQVLAKTISQRLRGVDFMARYGGEEFVMLLPQTTLQGGWQLMDKIRAAIAAAPFRFKQEPLRVTLSMGLVEVREEETIEQAFERADKVLYRAKAEGRNRCLLEE